MIRYPISLLELSRQVRRRIPTSLNRNGTPRRNGREAWIIRANRLSARLKARGHYDLDSDEEIWAELKPIFARIQGGGKCAYCETRLSSQREEAPSGHIDHYRPKRGVVEWKTAYSISAGGGDPDCYYRLTFHLRNYVLTCDVCNSSFKRNYFPVAGPRCSAGSSRPRDLVAERPYLLHPLDPNDADPEQLIEFEGIVPVPRAAQMSQDYWRAKVTIELLGLTGGNRLDLDLERADVIENLYLALKFSEDNDPTVRRIANQTLNKLMDDKLPHRNCARSFKRLYDANPAEATRLAEAARKAVDERLSRLAEPL